MAVIKWARAASYNKANTYPGANGEIVIDIEQNRLFLYDGAMLMSVTLFFSLMFTFLAELPRLTGLILLQKKSSDQTILDQVIVLEAVVQDSAMIQTMLLSVLGTKVQKALLTSLLVQALHGLNKLS